MDDDDDTPARDRLDAVTFEGSVLLGGSVRMEIGPRVTVLVGRNAAGKSLLLESLDEGTAAAALDADVAALSASQMHFELSLAGSRVDYSFKWQQEIPSDDEESPEVVWSERCEDEGGLLWQVDAGAATLSDGRKMSVPMENGLLHVRDNAVFPVPPEVALVRRLFKGMHRIGAGVPRHAGQRAPLRLYKGQNQIWNNEWYEHEYRIVECLALLLQWYERRRALFDEVKEVCQRLQIFKDIEVKIETVGIPEKRTKAPAYEGQVLVDRVNLGCLSDGTLRVMEIVIRLIDPATTVLLLEEPETGIHPGLLHRLLAELEAYAREKQIVFSTHAPGLLNWAKPEDVRLVERTDGVTSVRRLTEEELHRVRIYLDDDLGLSDFVFSGALG